MTNKTNNTQPNTKSDTHTRKVQDIHLRRYLSTIHVLPDLRQKKTQDYLEVGLTLLALILAGAFAIYPTLTTMADLQRELIDTQKVSTQLSNKNDALHALYGQYSTLHTQPVYNQIFQAIPQSPQAQLLVAYVQAVGHENNLSEISLSIQPGGVLGSTTTPAASKSTTPYLLGTFAFTGTYSDIEKFLDELTNFQRMIVIQSINITKGLDANSLALSVSLAGYYLP